MKVWKKMRQYINLVIGGLVAFVICGVVLLKYIHKWSLKLSKMNGQMQYFQRYYSLLVRWKRMEQEGTTLAERIHEAGYSRIAVYGMGELGWLVCDELLQSGIEVAYAIDKEADNLSYNAFTNIPDVRLKLPEEDLDSVDLVIVTALKSYQEIRTMLQERYSYKVMSIEELIK